MLCGYNGLLHVLNEGVRTGRILQRKEVSRDKLVVRTRRWTETNDPTNSGTLSQGQKSPYRACALRGRRSCRSSLEAGQIPDSGGSDPGEGQQQ